MEKINLTVIIMAKNEEENILAAIKSASFASEILVIDDYSTDKTAEIAIKQGAKVIARELNGDFASQLNFAIKKARSNYVFILDADERINSKLAESIAKTIQNEEQITGIIKRKNYLHIAKATHGTLRADFIPRLFLKTAIEVRGQVHPSYCSSMPNKLLSGHLIHFPYKSWEQYLHKGNLYTTLAAAKYKQQGRKCFFLLDIVIKPFWAFFKMYFWHLGFLDGKIGFILAFNHATYTMNKYAKLMTDGKL